MSSRRLRSAAAMLVIAAAIGMTTISCSSEPSSPVRFEGSSEALAAYDRSPSGIYRGVIAADTATGTFRVALQGPDVLAASGELASAEEGGSPGHSAPSFSFSISDTKGNQVRSQRDGTVSTTGRTTSYHYAGTLSEPGAAGGALAVSLTLQLSPEGRVIQVDCRIGDAPAAVVAMKELSTTQVVTFEGTYAGTNSGIWNMIIAGDAVFAAYAAHDGSAQGALSGSRRSDALDLSGPEGLIRAAGTVVSETNIAGKWTEQIGEPGSGTFGGKRSSVP